MRFLIRCSPAVQFSRVTVEVTPRVRASVHSGATLCSYQSKGRRLLEEAWLRVGAIIAEFSISGYGLRADSARRLSVRAEPLTR